MHCLVFDFIAIFTLHNAVFHYSTKASLHHLKVITSTINFPTKKHTFWRKNTSFQNNNPKAIGNFPFRSKRQSLQKNHIQIIWMFPKIVVPPKWMVYNGKPYFLMDDLGRTPPIFGNIHIDSQSAKSACLSRMSFVNWLCALSLLEPSSLPRFNSPATVEGVLRGKSCCWSCFLRVKKNVVDWFFG